MCIFFLIIFLALNIQDNNRPISDKDFNTFDLNTLSPEEVAVYKKKMDDLYRTNQILPGDPNYQYDIQVYLIIFFFYL
jgi:hypothetical protein